jgi:hypothetical protein
MNRQEYKFNLLQFVVWAKNGGRIGKKTFSIRRRRLIIIAPGPPSNSFRLTRNSGL